MHGIAELHSPTLDAMLALVRRHTGIAMSERKQVLLEGRLRPRLRALALSSYEEYLALIERDGPEVQVFINMVTTNDTQFFRTPAVWDYLRATFLPAWQRRADRATLRIWSAAAASGEEAYSLAMLCEDVRRLHAGFRYQIVGTDISTEMVQAASAGSYAGRSAQQLRELHPALCARYFQDDQQGLRARPELQAHVSFRQHNLLTGSMAGTFDLVLLRNVLIYFDAANQQALLGQVRRAMASDARLILGEQESITRLASDFVFEQAHVYRSGGEHA